MTSGSWTFEPQTRFRPSGENLAEPNFNREDRDIENIFLREFDQNVLDARQTADDRPDGKSVAHVRFSLLRARDGLDVDYLRRIVDENLERHLRAAGHPAEQRNWSDPVVLTVEEFGTTGLIGQIDNTYAEGEGERWANFWFGEAKRTKGGSSLGRKGQGKITYHVISGARAVFALTKRVGETGSYLFGKCIAQSTHELDGEHYTQHGYWPKIEPEKDNQPIPDTSEKAIEAFRNAFRLTRKHQDGTSWVIPFVPDQFDAEILTREFVRDFYFSILRGSLTADICGTSISESNIREVIRDLDLDSPSNEFIATIEEAITRPAREFAEIAEEWQTSTTISDESIDADILSSLRARLANGELISLKLPITVHKRQESGKSAPLNSWIEVHVRQREHGFPTEELYVRSGLSIADEKHLKDASRSALGLVLADDGPIAEFLGYCEVASHLQWNNREKGAAENFERVPQTLALVRKSLPRIYRLIAGSSAKVDEDALLDILSVPQTGATTKKARGKTKKDKDETKPDTPRIERQNPQLFRLSDQEGTWSLTPGPEAGSVLFPLSVRIRFAYDRIEGTGNPWKLYHPFDFDLSDTQTFVFSKTKNVSICEREMNHVDAEISSPDFEIQMAGFSTDQPLLSKVEYDADSTSPDESDQTEVD